MRDPRLSPDRLAVIVADGEPIDWDEALQSAADDEERRVIRQLRLVERVASVHRSDGSPAPSMHDSPTMTQAPDEPAQLEPLRAGATWGHLELRQRLGHGSFGDVYRAWDSRLDREVALKLLKTDESKGKAFASTAVAEGRLLAKLRHPNVVTVYGAEIRDGRVGFWMEYIRGRSLEQLLRDHGPLGAREAALIGVDLCRALAAVHGAGVVHRDVKAQNVMREEGGRILLTDFGAGIDLGATARDRASVSGTPLYMAPEVFRGEPVTQRSDIFSLGVLLYHLVTAAFPTEARSWEELREKHARGDAKLLRDRRPDLPEAFVAVVERALAHDPDQRFLTGGQMEHALSLALGTASGPAPPVDVRRRPAFPVRGALVLAAAVVVTGLLVVPSLLRRSETGRQGSGSAGRLEEVADPTPAPSTSTPIPAPYTVEAAFYRSPAKSVARERLEPGARLTLGDRLTLELKATTPLHLYVIDEDEAGHSYALFPLPGLDQQNPLPAGATHVLPGSRNGKDLSWTVDSAGGREHLMVLASPTRLVEFEAEMNALARPGQTAVAIPESAKVRLRGIGGLAPAPAARTVKSAAPLFEMAQRLASRSEIVTGVWMRRIELENPRPE
jgi:serine/threonine-protein kinase